MAPVSSLAAVPSAEPRAPALVAVPSIPALPDSTLAAIGLIVLSTAFFSLGDIAAKALTDTMDGIQVTWFRFLVFALTIPVWTLAMRGPQAVRTRRPLLQVARGLAIAGASVCFIVGLAHLPAAENTAIAFLGPLFVTALSIPLLGEKVGVRRWAAALVGFLGVMIVVQPGTDAFKLAAIFPVGAALVGAFGTVFTRRMADELPEATLTWTALTGFAVMSLVVPFVWTTPGLVEVGYGLATGVLSTIGHVLVVQAFRRAGASILAPFTYVQLLFAGVLSYLLLSEIPSLWTFVGGAVIAASGLYTAHRERVVAREKRRAALAG